MNKTACMNQFCLFIALSFLTGFMRAQQGAPVVALENRTMQLEYSLSKAPFLLASGVTLATGLAVTWPLQTCWPRYLRTAAQNIVQKNGVRSVAVEINVSPAEQKASVRKIDEPWSTRLSKNATVCKSGLPCLLRLGAIAAATYVVGKLTHQVVNARQVASQAVASTQYCVNTYAVLVSVHTVVQHTVQSIGDGVVVGTLADHAVLTRLAALLQQYQMTSDSALVTLDRCSYSLFSDEASRVLVALKDDMRLVTGSYHVGKQDLFDAAYEHKDALELIARLHMLSDQQKQSPQDRDGMLDTAQQCNQLLMGIVAEFESTLQDVQARTDSALYWTEKMSPLMNFCGLAKVSAMVARSYLSKVLHRGTED